MKNIIRIAVVLALSVFAAGRVSAQPTGLTPPYSGQTVANTCGLAANCGELIASLNSDTGTLIPLTDNTYDVGTTSFGYRSGYFDTSVLTPLVIPPGALTLRLAADANRPVVFTGASDTSITQLFGDGSTTALQTFLIGTATTNTDDDALLSLSGANVKRDARRGAFLELAGADLGGANAGDLELGAPDDMYFYTGIASDAVLRWTLDESGVLTSDATGGGGIVLAGTGDTLAVDSGTAASACAGTATATGTTAVTVATTCAATGARVFLVRTSAPSGTAQCWYDTIVNGTSFNLDCDGAETGTFAWWIQKEG